MKGSFDFYTTAAQVIPLVFVAIAFEGRTMWKPDQWEGFGVSKEWMVLIRATHMVVTTFFLVLGEAAALWALGHDAPVRFDSASPASLVGISLVAGGLLLVAQVSVQIQLEYRDGELPNPNTAQVRQRLQVVLAGVTIASVALAGYVVWAIVSTLSS